VKTHSGHEKIEAVDQSDAKTHPSILPTGLQSWVGNRDAIDDRANKERDEKTDVVVILQAERIGGLPNARNQSRSKRKSH